MRIYPAIFRGGDPILLLQDEQYVIKWLSQYGALTKTQVIRLLRDKSPQTAEKIIKNLKKQLFISDVAGGYYVGLDPMVQPDQRIILAVLGIASVYR